MKAGGLYWHSRLPPIWITLSFASAGAWTASSGWSRSQWDTGMDGLAAQKCEKSVEMTIGYYGILWDTIGYYGILWDTIGYYWILLDTIGYFWILLVPCKQEEGISWNILNFVGTDANITRVQDAVYKKIPKNTECQRSVKLIIPGNPCESHEHIIGRRQNLVWIHVQ